MCLSGRGVDPTERLHVFKIGMLWALVRQSHVLVATRLGDEYDTSDLLDLRVLGRTDTVHVACDLDS